MKKTALITGISGQDGSYLSAFLLEKNYHVVGLNKSVKNQQKNAAQTENVELITGDLTDQKTLEKIIREHKPNEIYNLASQSSPGESWKSPLETAMTNIIGTQLLFETARKTTPNSKIYHASSAAIHENKPNKKEIPIVSSPYAATKLYAHQIAGLYRKGYNQFISCGILFNHESPRRSLQFLPQKIAYAAACIKSGIKTSPAVNEEGEPLVKNNTVALGNLDAKRDWGYAGDYVEAMWLALQQEKPDDFIIGTGELRSIRDLCEAAFSCVGLNWENHVKVDPRFVRPIEAEPNCADISKAKKILGWQPKTTFSELIQKMVESNIEQIRAHLIQNA